MGFRSETTLKLTPRRIDFDELLAGLAAQHVLVRGLHAGLADEVLEEIVPRR